MKIAKVQMGKIVELGTQHDMFPNASFPVDGPTEDFLIEHQCSKVVDYIEHDANTHMLVEASPYIQDGIVYGVSVVERPAFDKNHRILNVELIQVTTSSGKTFDGNEISQTRMMRAILVAQANGVTSRMWTLADNTTVEVTLIELMEALTLASQAQDKLWNKA